MKKTLMGIVALSALILSGIIGFFANQTSKVAYVNNVHLFEEFKGKKELEARLFKREHHQKAILDSLELNIKSLQTQLARNQNAVAVKTALKDTEHKYQQIGQQFIAQSQQDSETYNNAIWKQINQYIIEYGEEKGYDIIYGASGNGALMYGNKSLNITEEVIQYINGRYEGL